MAAELVIAQEAEQDIADSYAWYEDRRAGLGEEFLSCVDAYIQAICRTPTCMHRSTKTTVVAWCDASHMRFSTNMQRIS
jgi:hypothetical protein